MAQCSPRHKQQPQAVCGVFEKLAASMRDAPHKGGGRVGCVLLSRKICCCIGLFLVATINGTECYGSEEMTVDKTVAWINGILGESNGWIMSIYTKADNTLRNYEHYSVKVGTSGSLHVSYTLTTGVIGSERDPITLPKSEPIDDWLSLKPSGIAIVRFKETSWGSKLQEAQPEDEIDLGSHVLAVKQDGDWKFLLPLGPSSLQEKFLKAFRHLLEQSKKEHTDPFK
jgi:hypothetical protein